MRALVWHGKEDIRCDVVSDPAIQDPRDAIVKVTSCAICGSDLHLFHNFVPAMLPGDIMGHEMMGEVVETGSGVTDTLKVGDRIVVPFTIICGQCEQCKRGNFSVCERTNRNKHIADKVFGHTTAGLFGYTHLTGGYPGGQAEYFRGHVCRYNAHQGAGQTDRRTGAVPGRHFPYRLAGRHAVCRSRRPTRSRSGAADRSGKWRSAVRSLLGARQVVAIDQLPGAAQHGRGGRRHHDQLRPRQRRRTIERPHGRQRAREVHRRDRNGEPRDDRVADTIYDRAKQMMGVESDRPHVLREMIYVCRPAGLSQFLGSMPDWWTRSRWGRR